MKKAPVTVGLIGIPHIEEKRLQTAFSFSCAREPHYILEDIENIPNILMVNADEPSSLIIWRSYRSKLEESGIMIPPSIVVSKSRVFNTKHYQVKRPLVTSRIISILDQVVINEFSLDTESMLIYRQGGKSTDEKPLKSVETLEKSNELLLPRALVVDDSLPVRIQMSQVLKAFANVDFAVTGEEALPLVEENQYDLIFLDVVLPGADGYEVCKKIRKTLGKNTPVIMLTSNSSPADRIRGKLAGCDTYLIKPISETIFTEVLRHYI